MKKINLRKILCLSSVALILLSASACKKSGEDLSDEYSYYTEVINTPSKTNSQSSKSNDNSAVSSGTQGNASKITTNTSKPSGNSDVKKPINQNASATTLSRDQVIASMPSKLKNTTITYMYWNDPRKQMDSTAIKGFEKATGCKVNCVVASYSSFQEELASRISSGNAPDLVRLLGNVSWQITSLQPITNSGYNFNDKAWDAQTIKDFTFNGNCYAVNLKDSAISDVAVIYYNKAALRDAEMEDPYQIWSKNNHKDWTWEKFWSMCEEFVTSNKGKSGYSGATFEYNDAYPRAIGGSLYTYDSSKGKFVNNSKAKGTIDGWKKTLEMQEKGFLLKGHDVNSFDQGKTLFFWSGPFSARKMDARQSKLKDKNMLGVVPIPTDSLNQVMYEYTAFGIPKGAKNAAAVPYYLRYVLDKSSYNMDSLYCSKEAKTVIEYACSRPNRIYGYCAGLSNVLGELSKAGSANVKSVLDQYYDSINEFMDKENARISTYE